MKRRLIACALAGAATVTLVSIAAPAPITWLRFEDGAERAGIRFAHVPTRSPERLMPEVLGSGVVIADFNRDGAPDVLLVNSGALSTSERSQAARNRLYLNDGRGRFSDATEAWGLPSPGYGMGAAAGDYDNDGWTDLYLTTYGGADALLRNEHGRFVDVTRRAGLVSDGRWSTSAGFFDYDGDGALDLYVVRYVDYTPKNAVKCWHNAVHVYCAPQLYAGVADRLWRNDGNGTFTDMSARAGIAQGAGKGLGLVIGDVDQDGNADVYVANDSSPSQLWMGDGHGRWRDEALAAGVALSENGAEQAGMGADLSDSDGDGLLDLVRTNFQGETTSLYRQGPARIFREVSDVVGIGQTARARLKFGVAFLDADNDGDADLLVANGHIEDNVASHTPSVSFAQRNTLYENIGRGVFRDVSDVAGSALQDKQVSRGLATGDLDGDGRLDYVVNNNGGTAQVAFNSTPQVGNFVSLWLEGRAANRSAIGARVVARVGARSLRSEVRGASSYLSVCDFRVHLGLGPATVVDELTVYWPGGKAQVLRGLAAGRHYRLVEGRAPVPFQPGEQVVDAR